MTSERDQGRPAAGGAVLRPGVTRAITAAVFAEIAEAGYARLSMEGVARRAHVGKAALYRRWPSKSAMLTETIRGTIADTIPPVPDTGDLRGDLRELLATYRSQLANPLLAQVAPGLWAEAVHDPSLEVMLQTEIAAPRRAAARAILQAAIERGDLPRGLDLEIGTDLLLAPLAFRILVIKGHSDDAYLETLTDAVGAALGAAVRRPNARG
jgi:AcrR family transcriptional regulator